MLIFQVTIIRRSVNFLSGGSILWINIKILLTIITVCVVVTLIVGSAIIHDHDDEHDGEYHEYMEHIIERLESIEERLDNP